VYSPICVVENAIIFHKNYTMVNGMTMIGSGQKSKGDLNTKESPFFEFHVKERADVV